MLDYRPGWIRMGGFISNSVKKPVWLRTIPAAAAGAAAGLVLPKPQDNVIVPFAVPALAVILYLGFSPDFLPAASWLGGYALTTWVIPAIF